MSKWYRLLRYDWPLHFVLLLTNWLPDNVVFVRFRGWLARPFFKKCGKNLGLGRDLTFYNSSQVILGENIYIAKGCWFLALDEIRIEDEVIFGPYVVVVTANHSCANGSYKTGPIVDKKPVVVGRGAWIAAHSTILPGSNIAPCTLIAANSVFGGGTVRGGVYGGVPARKIKEIKI